MKVDTVTVSSVKQLLGPNHVRAKGKQLEAMTTMQFALERLVERLAAVEGQCDGLARQDKQKEIDINHLKLRLARLEQRGVDE